MKANPYINNHFHRSPEPPAISGITWVKPPTFIFPPRAPKRTRGPQQRILDTLTRLREIRLEEIKAGRPIPKKAIAMEMAGGISEKSWKVYELELWVRWYDKTYQ